MSKEARQQLQSERTTDSRGVSAATEGYALLDRATRASQEYLGKRAEEREAALISLKAAAAAKHRENEVLQREVDEAEAEVDALRTDVAEKEAIVRELDAQTKG